MLKTDLADDARHICFFTTYFEILSILHPNLTVPVIRYTALVLSNQLYRFALPIGCRQRGTLRWPHYAPIHRLWSNDARCFSVFILNTGIQWIGIPTTQVELHPRLAPLPPPACPPTRFAHSPAHGIIGTTAQLSQRLRCSRDTCLAGVCARADDVNRMPNGLNPTLRYGSKLVAYTSFPICAVITNL